jgi:predicted nucleic acid-binding protein
MQKILALKDEGKLELFVSLQNLSELEENKDQATELANSIDRLPHYGVGSWDEQVGTWKDQAGTWNEGKEDEERQKRINELAKAGSSIRDRGGYIDAIRNNLDAFVTSDKQFVATGPAERLNAEFETKVLTPQEVVKFVSI